MIANLSALILIVLMTIFLALQVINIENFTRKNTFLYYVAIVICGLCGLTSILYFINGSIIIGFIWIFNVICWIFNIRNYKNIKEYDK